MKLGFLKAALVIASPLMLSMMMSSTAHAQVETQEQLFQSFQAMVIIDEVNQHCPILSRLEAEVLNGEIVFANENFSGKLDKVEKFKREARLFARRASCNAPEIMALVGGARQKAYDAIANHMLLARQIHIFDEQNRMDYNSPRGLLLETLTEDQWGLIESFHDEVKNNYLEKADQEAWDKYMSSIIQVAEERTAITFLKNEQIMQSKVEMQINVVKAVANNRGIVSYYHYLEKSVLAFIEGGNASELDYPFSRPANDFTNWTAFRPRTENLNWVVSYPRCGVGFQNIECTFFTTQNNEIGVVILGNEDNVIEKVELINRDLKNEELRRANKAVEGPIGSNEIHVENMTSNVKALKSSEDKNVTVGEFKVEYAKYGAQTGTKLGKGSKVFIFPKDVLKTVNGLHKNDVLILQVLVKNAEGKEMQESIMPVHNYNRARSWAYTAQ